MTIYDFFDAFIQIGGLLFMGALAIGALKS